MKSFATIEKMSVDNSRNIRHEGNSNSLFMLISFLYSDIPGSLLYESILLWLSNKKEGKVFSSNTHSLKEDDDNVILIDHY